MAHEIMEDDAMFSVREVPWHGLGEILTDYPTIAGAITASGLSWDVSVEKMTVPMFFAGQQQVIEVPDDFAVIREDTHKVVGVVGNRYEPYQNSEMWGFIENFQNQSGIKLETAGSLKNGRTTWVLAKNGIMEAIHGDPIEEFFLFRNSFDGSSPISVMFTNIRVVCNNTLTAAIRGARNIYNVRHTASAADQIKEVQKALGLRAKYQSKVNLSMEALVKYKMDATRSINFLEEVIFPEPKRIVQTVDKGEIVHTFEEATQRAQTTRTNNVNNVLELLEGGAGADIKGVKGTAYGMFNALTEWADHEKSVRVMNGRNEAELRFENAFFGTGAKFKSACFTELMKVAA